MQYRQVEEREHRKKSVPDPELNLRTKDSWLSVNLTPTDRIRSGGPTVELLASLQDRRFKLTYEMSGDIVSVRDRLSRIQRNHEERTQEARRDATASLAPQPSRKSESTDLQDGVVELLTWQSFLDAASALREVADFDNRQYKEQDLLLDKVADMYHYWLTTILDRVRNRHDGVQFISTLLRSEQEILVNLGVRLAREPALRPALQEELVGVYRDDSLSPETRRHAFNSMQPITQEAVVNEDNLSA
ncbi:hypothetical protein ABZ614_01725 [Streptomyces sp. NPDC013178]|uniref:hypothetical protein n=1 Tax=unclassified Streptomyces TaxID=2593676 RepID=UPI0033DE70A0